MDKASIQKRLQAQININGHIIGVAAGSGMTAKYAAMGGADFILALSAGKFRMMGRSSLASFLCYSSSNQMVLELGKNELLPVLLDTPVLFGIHANDPTIHLNEFIHEIKEAGFSGINNFPTIGLIDGQFREALEEEGITFEKEVEAIRIAHSMGLFTVAFIFTEEQAMQMVDAGADVLCVHLGLTKGGILGARSAFSIEQAKRVTDRIFKVIEGKNKNLIKMVYGGPASNPMELNYLYENSELDGYIGGSTFERIPTEKAILETAHAFKKDSQNEIKELLDRAKKNYDYVGFVKGYVAIHYCKRIRLSELAMVAHISSSYLSTKFKQEVGYSFTEYLVQYRMNKATEKILEGGLTLKEVAQKVGYSDYAQFSKMFKKYKGSSPKKYLRTHHGHH